MKKITRKPSIILTAALLLVISMFGGGVHAEDLGQTEQAVTIPGETPAMAFSFDDDNPATPPVEVTANSIKDVTLKYSWNATNPAEVVTVIGAAKKCHAASRINQLILIGLNDSGGELLGSISYEERNSNDQQVADHVFPFSGAVDEDGGAYELSLCVR